jgi:molybdopterin molybdotransferase
MLTVEEAIGAILAHVTRPSTTRVPLSAGLGLVLAEDAVCDLDSPPFDKALMDGFAVRAADVPAGRATLHVIDEVMAGQVSQKSVGPGQAVRIMTGAPIPAGADAVVPVERTLPAESATSEIVIKSAPLATGKNILKRGESTRKGDRVVAAGRQLRPQEIGTLAELGKAEISVYARPRVAVLATGDELVPIGSVPGPGQIRNSNEAMLAAQLQQIGADPQPLGVARDEPADLREKINRGLACDVLLLSGGVSAGQLDLVPNVLSEAGVRQIFHRVRVKPGQPIWFGVLEAHRSIRPPPTQQCYVFGLPGNPVSSMVCCELFVRTAIRRLMGIEPAAPVPLRGRLTCDHFNSGNRPTYHPARWEMVGTEAVVTPVKWIGSADLIATVEANALALFAEGDRMYGAGTLVDVILL